MGLIGLGGVMAIDVTTMALAILMLLLIHIPQPERSAAGRQGQGSVWKEAAFGFRYIFERPSLLGLQLVFFAGNMISAFGQVAVIPMIMLRTGDDKLILGSVQSVAGIGMLAGSLLVSIWSGPRRKVHGVLIGHALSGLLGFLLVGLGRTPAVWALAAFLGFSFYPLVNASNQAIWQAKVAPDVQGRVFSVRRLIAQISWPLATLVGGPLADYVFKPAMQPQGPLAPLFGGLVGTGPGAGMALMLVLAGVLGTLAGLAGYAFRPIREAETILPDHGAEEEAAPAEAPATV
jgi:predicted MFS family arabinose efflux permease